MSALPPSPQSQDSLKTPSSLDEKNNSSNSRTSSLQEALPGLNRRPIKLKKKSRKPILKSSVTIFWACVFLLVGTVGAISLGIHQLQSILTSTEKMVEVEATSNALRTAQVLKKYLSSPDCLKIIPEEYLFTIEKGRLSVPPEVEWLSTPENLDLPDTFPKEVRDELQLAREAEYIHKDFDRSLTLLLKAKSSPQIESLQKAWLLLNAANLANRRNRQAARDSCLKELTDLKIDWKLRQKTIGKPVDQILAGWLLLILESQTPIPSLFLETFPKMSANLAGGLIESAQNIQLGLNEELFQKLSEQQNQISQKRARLRQVKAIVPILLNWRNTIPRDLSGDLVFYFPNSISHGKGAWIPPDVILNQLKEFRKSDPIAFPASGKLSLENSSDPLSTSIQVVSSISVIPDFKNRIERPSKNWITASLITLALFLGLGTFLSLRALNQERWANQARSDFLTAVTHELKTPLSSIRLLTEILSEKESNKPNPANDQRMGPPKDTSNKLQMDRLAAETARLSLLVDNVLDLGRLERGERGYDLQPQDFNMLVKEAIHLYSPIARRDGMEIHLDLSSEQMILPLDKTSIIQLLLNLFENARRYAEEGKYLGIRTVSDPEKFRVYIEDRGPGIPLEERESIFKKFTKGYQAAQGGNPGVGLGLFLSRMIAREHSGDLKAIEPVSGEGACFQLELPNDSNRLKE